MRIRILDSALEDLDRGRRFYERQGEGLGDYFLDSLFSEIDSLLIFAGIHREVFGYHRLIAKRFPYAVYYLVDTNRDPVVYRILDCRRDPKRIRRSDPGHPDECLRR